MAGGDRAPLETRVLVHPSVAREPSPALGVGLRNRLIRQEDKGTSHWATLGPTMKVAGNQQSHRDKAPTPSRGAGAVCPLSELAEAQSSVTTEG